MNDKEVAKYTTQIEHLRIHTSEFAHLNQHIFLDHAANAIYTSSMVDSFAKKLTGSSPTSSSWSLFSNPHSHSQSAQYTSMCIQVTRERLLRQLFNTSSTDYDLVFVHNTTHALKVVAENFNFLTKTTDHQPGNNNAASFVYLSDNHTSAIGMREVVWQKQERKIGRPAVNVYCLNEVENNTFAINLVEPPSNQSNFFQFKDEEAVKDNYQFNVIFNYFQNI
jgi:selenocysteine lyase/cysteine desulfurase